jgi:hypothetical protein
MRYRQSRACWMTALTANTASSDCAVVDMVAALILIWIFQAGANPKCATRLTFLKGWHLDDRERAKMPGSDRANSCAAAARAKSFIG